MLEVEDLTFAEDGVKILIRKSKTDQEGAGQTVAIARGVNLCPVTALKAWPTTAGITGGPIFHSVNRYGRVQPDAITAQVVALVVEAIRRRGRTRRRRSMPGTVCAPGW